MSKHHRETQQQHRAPLAEAATVDPWAVDANGIGIKEGFAETGLYWVVFPSDSDGGHCLGREQALYVIQDLRAEFAAGTYSAASYACALSRWREQHEQAQPDAKDDPAPSTKVSDSAVGKWSVSAGISETHAFDEGYKVGHEQGYKAGMDAFIMNRG